MKSLLTIVVLSVALASCSLEQVDDAFTLPHPEYDAKWHPDVQWTMEDIQVYVNRQYDEEARKTPKFRNRTCLPIAESKYKMAVAYGYNEDDLEIVVIKLSPDMALKAYWPTDAVGVKHWPTHAMLRYKDEIFDNGFIAEIPFDIQYLDRYGEKVEDVWSRYQK